MSSVQRYRNVTLQLPHMDGVQGESERRTEADIAYVEGAAELSTQQSAISDGGASGSVRRQAGTVREL